MSKIVTVIGATGNQGGSVVSTLLSTPALRAKYSVRAVTRDKTKAAAKELEGRGVEVVEADLSDRASLSRAFAGSYAVFGITDYWQILSHEGEVQYGKNIADASFAAGVRHLVWSSLPHAARLTGGKLADMAHFDAKADVEAYVEANKAGTSTSTSYFLPAVFMSNVSGSVRKGLDGGAYAWAGPLDPEVRVPWIDIRADTGKWVVGLLEAGPEAADGARVQAVGEWLSPGGFLELVGEANGAEGHFAQIPRDVFKGFLPPHMAEELTETMELMTQYQYYGLGSEKDQPESDRWLLEGTSKTSVREFARDAAWPQ